MTRSRIWRVVPAAVALLAAVTASAVLAESRTASTSSAAAPPNSWTSTYDWASATPTGFAGWVAAGTPDLYANAQTFGGRGGLWLWPTGGHDYAAGSGAEWRLDAPGTTNVLSASVVVSYAPQVFAHHCLVVGITGNAPTTYCKPPPGGGSSPSLQADLTGTPGKTLTVRLEVPAGSGTKNVPANDPAKGSFVRVDSVKLTLTDDEAPTVATSGPLTAIAGKFTDGSKTYAVDVATADPGSGIARTAFAVAGTETASAKATCDVDHRNADNSSRVCPTSLPLSTSVDLLTRPEGQTDFTASTQDLAGRTAATTFSTFVDRTAPNAPTASGALYDARGFFLNGARSYDVAVAALDPGEAEKKASGIARLAVESGANELAAGPVAACTDASCPVSASLPFTIDASKLPEGENAFTPRTTDFVGHSTDGVAWTLGVDRRSPDVAPAGALRALDGGFVAGDRAYAWTAAATDPQPVPRSASGVRRIRLFADGNDAGGTVVCDARACDAAATATGSFDTTPLTEGRHTFLVKAEDVVGNEGASAPWTFSVDRTAPAAADAFQLNDLDLYAGHAVVGWAPIADANLADGSPGVGVAKVEARWQLGGDWSAWQSLGADGRELAVDGISRGGALNVEVRATDKLGHVSAAASGNFDIPSTDEVDSTSCANDISFGGEEPAVVGGALSLTQTAGTVQIASDPSNGVTVSTADGSTVNVGIPNAGSAGDAVRVAAGAVHFDTASNGTDTVVSLLPDGESNPCQPVPQTDVPFEAPIDANAPGLGVDLMTVIDGESSPTEFDFPVNVPAGGSIVAADGGFQIRDAQGQAIIQVDPPRSVDDNGEIVDTTATLTGTTLHVHVDHPGHGFAYPIVLDPQYRITSDAAATAPAAAKQEATQAVSLGKPGVPNLIVCKAIVQSTVQGGGAAVQMHYGGHIDPRDCKGIGSARPNMLYLKVCLQHQDPQTGDWPHANGGNCTGSVSGGWKVAAWETVDCTRYGYYRIWMSGGGTVRGEDGKIYPIIPKVGVVNGSLNRCLPVPSVDWYHIFNPDTRGGKSPSGWHHRNCIGAGVGNGLCLDPPGAEILEDTCLYGKGDIYGCKWRFQGAPAKGKYSTFFPNSWTRADVQNWVVLAYMNARFYKNGNWVSPPLFGYGWSIAGKIDPNDADRVLTAYPNVNLNKDRRAVQIVEAGGDPIGGGGGGGDTGGGGGGGGSGAPRDVYVTVTTARGQRRRGEGTYTTWVSWDSAEAETGQGGIMFCRASFSYGDPGFDMGPAGGPQEWDTLPGFIRVTCWGISGGVGADESESF